MKYLRDLPGGYKEPNKDWYIGPVGHSRDSDAVEESNWRVVVKELNNLDPSGEHYEIHRFGHFAVGWIEEIAFKPFSIIEDYYHLIKASLEIYPILCEFNLSEVEHEFGE